MSPRLTPVSWTQRQEATLRRSRGKECSWELDDPCGVPSNSGYSTDASPGTAAMTPSKINLKRHQQVKEVLYQRRLCNGTPYGGGRARRAGPARDRTRRGRHCSPGARGGGGGGQRGGGVAGSEGGRRRLGGGDGGQRRAGEHGQAEQQQQRRGKAIAGPLRRHPPRHVRGGAGGAPAPLGLLEEVGGEGPQAGACEAVQLFQNLCFLLVHLRKQRRSAPGQPRFPSPGPPVHPMPDLAHPPRPHRIPHLLPLGFRVVSVAEQVAQSVGYGHLRRVGNKTHVLPTEPHDRPAAHHARPGLTVRTSSKSSPVSRHCWWMYSTPRKMSPRLYSSRQRGRGSSPAATWCNGKERTSVGSGQCR